MRPIDGDLTKPKGTDAVTTSAHLTEAVPSADVVDGPPDPDVCSTCGRYVDDGRQPWPAHRLGWPCAGPECHALALDDWPAAEPFEAFELDDVDELPALLDGCTDLVDRVAALLGCAQLVAGLAKLCEADPGESRETAEAELCAVWAAVADRLHRTGPASRPAAAALRDAAVELRRVARDQR